MKISVLSLIKLTHHHTPKALSSINEEIECCLANAGGDLNADPINDSHLKILIDQREKLVNLLLKELAEPEVKHFAKAELTVNDALLALVSSIRDEAKATLTGITKSSKAIKQYQKV
ncbi:hypothetical protein PN836_006210 [Ningiella sp. W23]|uniref:hypothetical protein n=1 Tax=Ningiella sp. W23 TaxID=3023715 RepID=UPI0037583727